MSQTNSGKTLPHWHTGTLACIKASSLSPAPLALIPCFLAYSAIPRCFSHALSFHTKLLSCRDDLQVIHHSSIYHNPYFNFDILRVRRCCCHCSCWSVPRCTRRALLTSDLGFARQGYAQSAVTGSATTSASNKKRFGKLLFLGLVTRDGLC